jgi:hypothetical protein
MHAYNKGCALGFRGAVVATDGSEQRGKMGSGFWGLTRSLLERHGKKSMKRMRQTARDLNLRKL